MNLILLSCAGAVLGARPLARGARLARPSALRAHAFASSSADAAVDADVDVLVVGAGPIGTMLVWAHHALSHALCAVPRRMASGADNLLSDQILTLALSARAGLAARGEILRQSCTRGQHVGQCVAKQLWRLASRVEWYVRSPGCFSHNLSPAVTQLQARLLSADSPARVAFFAVSACANARPLTLAFLPPSPAARAALEAELGFGLPDCLDYRWKHTDSYFGGEGSGGVPEDQPLRINKVQCAARAFEAARAARCRSCGRGHVGARPRLSPASAAHRVCRVLPPLPRRSTAASTARR